MIGPDGTRYDNRMVFLEIRKPERLVMDHGSDKDDDPARFRVTITFDEQSNKKTVVTLRQLHPTGSSATRSLASARWKSGTRRSTGWPITCAAK